MTKRDTLEENYPDSKMLYADGLDDALIGVDHNQWVSPEKDCEDSYRAIYSVSKIIKVLMERDEMDYETAREFFDFNIAGAYMGKQTPIFCEDEFLS